MSGRMWAAVLHAPGDVRLERRPLPEPGRGELLVRLRACGLCASDAMDWYVAAKAPFVLGHEPVATVAGGDAATGVLAPGTRVFVHHHAPCGDCDACRRGDAVHCGTWRAAALDPGGMAEYARVLPQAVRADVLPLPDSVDDLDGTLVEPVACAVKALRRAAFTSGERVFIVGLGFMGQVLGRLARRGGAAWVGGSDPIEDRRKAALAWADAAVSLEAAARGLNRAAGAEPADLVIVTPPSEAALRQAFATVRDGGRVLLYAPTPRGEDVPVPLGDLFFREVDLLFSYSAGPQDTRAALESIARGVVRAADLVSHVLPLERVAEAYRLVKKPDVLKVVVTIDRG
ncbi:MAG TPA: alcohol dehydrogenase catalytic domain-containing protein [Bacillota bacterium]